MARNGSTAGDGRSKGSSAAKSRGNAYMSTDWGGLWD